MLFVSVKYGKKRYYFIRLHYNRTSDNRELGKRTLWTGHIKGIQQVEIDKLQINCFQHVTTSITSVSGLFAVSLCSLSDEIDKYAI